MSYSLILVMLNIIIFIIQIIFPPFTKMFWLDPAQLANKPWTLITSMFLHGSFLHLFFNMYALFLFGPIVERKMGGKDFLKLYFISGIVGGLLYYLTYVINIIPSLPALGASGAVYGVVAAAAVFYPYIKLFIFPFPIPITLREAVILWIVISLIQTFDIYGGIAGAAHLGGILSGYIIAKSWKPSYEEWWWVE